MKLIQFTTPQSLCDSFPARGASHKRLPRTLSKQGRLRRIVLASPSRTALRATSAKLSPRLFLKQNNSSFLTHFFHCALCINANPHS